MRRRAWTALIAVAGCVAPACGSSRPVPEAVRPLVRRLDALVPRLLAGGGLPGLQVAVVHEGAAVWSAGYGFADARRRTRMFSDTLLRVWSLSKPVTAWGVMTLVESGRVELDEPVDVYLKRWHVPPSTFDASGVTARRLLAHTSGIGPRKDGPFAPSLVASLAGARLIAAPGDRFEYSDFGYSILQLLVEDVTRQSFDTFMQRSVLRPLGMSGASFAPDREALDGAATGHDPDRTAARSEVPPYRDSVIVDEAAFGLHATADDIARLIAAEMDGPRGEYPGRRVLRAGTAKTMLTAQPNSEGGRDGETYALGHSIQTPEEGDDFVSHGGASIGWRAYFEYAPVKRSGIVVLANGDAGQHVNPIITCEWRRWATDDPSHCGQFDVYVMRPDGTALQRLTRNPANDSFPTWSPDGSRIAFQSNRAAAYGSGRNFEIFVMNADGSGVLRLTEAPGSDSFPSWSPDGSRLAFASERDGDEEIYVMNADGTGQTRLTDFPGDDLVPSWSPGGKRIVWSHGADPGEQHDLWVMNADGAGRRRLTTTASMSEISPSWSPDGVSIVFANTTDHGVWVMNADGSFPRRIDQAFGDDRLPRWSPDGKAIVMTRDLSIEGEAELFAVKPDGSRPTQLTEAPGADVTAAWSPSGDRIAFASDR